MLIHYYIIIFVLLLFPIHCPFSIHIECADYMALLIMLTQSDLSTPPICFTWEYVSMIVNFSLSLSQPCDWLWLETTPLARCQLRLASAPPQDPQGQECIADGCIDGRMTEQPCLAEKPSHPCCYFTPMKRLVVRQLTHAVPVSFQWQWQSERIWFFFLWIQKLKNVSYRQSTSIHMLKTRSAPSM